MGLLICLSLDKDGMCLEIDVPVILRVRVSVISINVGFYSGLRNAQVCLKLWLLACFSSCQFEKYSPMDVIAINFAPPAKGLLQLSAMWHTYVIKISEMHLLSELTLHCKNRFVINKWNISIFIIDHHLYFYWNNEINIVMLTNFMLY